MDGSNINLTASLDVINYTDSVTWSGNPTLNEVRLAGISPDYLEFGKFFTKSITVAIGLLGLALNCFVLEASSKAPSKVLKSKILIMNSVVADMTLAIGSALVLMRYIFEGLGAERLAIYWVREINYHLKIFTLYLQVFASLLLSFDRLYAVVKPMKYHTVGYNTLSKIILIGLSWMCPAVLFFPEFFLLHSEFSAIVQPTVAISTNALTFILYMCIFGLFEYQRRTNRAVSESAEKPSKTLSLTLTYFGIHVSSLFLYLPGPIFSLLKGQLPTTVLPRKGWALVSQCLVILYYANTAVNPIILGARVRLIREQLTKTTKHRLARKTWISRNTMTTSVPSKKIRSTT